MVLSTEERVFLVEYVFREGNRYTDLVQEQFAEKFPKQLYLIAMQCLRIKLNGFRPVQTLVDITSSTLFKRTETFRTHCIKKNSFRL
jgi:hypothetical protein